MVVLGLQCYRVSEAAYECTVIRGILLRGNDNARKKGGMERKKTAAQFSTQEHNATAD